MATASGGNAVTPELIDAAHDYLRTILLPTPCELSPSISEALGREVWLKLELMLPTRSFKVRGALFKAETMSREGRSEPPSLATASTGNHGLGLAYAAKIHGFPATIFVPSGANRAKVRAMQALGATVVSGGTDWLDAYRSARAACSAHGFVYVHSFDDAAVIAGQGTIGLEIASQLPNADCVVVPIGGGGLIAGIATALATHSPTTRIIGVQPAGADAMRQSISNGYRITLPPVSTIADGLAAREVGELTYEIVSRLVASIETVQDSTMRKAMAMLLRDERLLVEPSGAASLGALLEAASSIPGDRVVCVVSGGNVDPSLLPSLVADAEASDAPW
jgi:threonine dehydratase